MQVTGQHECKRVVNWSAISQSCRSILGFRGGICSEDSEPRRNGLPPTLVIPFVSNVRIRGQIVPVQPAVPDKRFVRSCFH
jgi:hypothetical protein